MSYRNLFYILSVNVVNNIHYIFTNTSNRESNCPGYSKTFLLLCEMHERGNLLQNLENEKNFEAQKKKVLHNSN